MKQLRRAQFHLHATGVALLILTVVGLAAANCGGTPPPKNVPTSVVGQLAVKGRQVTAAMNGVLSGLDQIMAAEPAVRPAGIKVIEGVRAAADHMVHMAETLRVIDETTVAIARARDDLERGREEAKRAAGIERARLEIKSLQTMVQNLTLPIDAPKFRQQVALLLGFVTDALLDLSFVLPQLQGVPAR